MENKFNLSDKIWGDNGELALINPSHILVRDVREFIRLLKKELCFRDCGKCGHESYGRFITEEDIDELAGKDLISTENGGKTNEN